MILKPQLIHEEKSFLIINKPAGLLMHGMRKDPTGGKKSGGIHSEATVAGWLAKNYPETSKVGDDPEQRPGIVHRLDKDTSGIMIVCRTQKFFDHAKELFKKREVQKKYLALTRGHLERERNIIDKPLGIRPGTTQRSIRSTKMRKDAVTEYHVLERAIRANESEDGARFKSTLLEALPHTGRTHQIRVHLTSIGHPILGDKLYGPKQPLSWVPRLMLHSFRISFALPSGKIAEFSAPPDKVFENTLREAGIVKNYTQL